MCDGHRLGHETVRVVDVAEHCVTVTAISCVAMAASCCTRFKKQRSNYIIYFCNIFHMCEQTRYIHVNPWAKTIKKKKYSTQNKSQTQRARSYELESHVISEHRL